MKEWTQSIILAQFCINSRLLVSSINIYSKFDIELNVQARVRAFLTTGFEFKH